VETVRGRPFCDREYLAMNLDVRAGVAAGISRSARDHLEHFGHGEGRLGRATAFGYLPPAAEPRLNPWP
jgi:hypothetical protein